MYFASNLDSFVFFTAMFIIFRDVAGNTFSDPAESIMGMFMMSLGEFGDLYDSFENLSFAYSFMGIVISVLVSDADCPYKKLCCLVKFRESLHDTVFIVL